MKNRLLLTIFYSIISTPAHAHDFTWMLWGEGLVILSLILSVYVVGPGNRMLWVAILAVIWGLLWGSLFITGNLLPLMAGSALLIFAQPLLALAIRKYRIVNNQGKQNNE